MGSQDSSRGSLGFIGSGKGLLSSFDGDGNMADCPNNDVSDFECPGSILFQGHCGCFERGSHRELHSMGFGGSRYLRLYVTSISSIVQTSHL
jgi:hypothetical protein